MENEYGDFGNTLEDAVATLSFVETFRKTFCPDKEVFSAKDMRFILKNFQEVIINLSLAKGHAVTRQEASDYWIERSDVS
jgi:hypothetical protein